MAKEKTIKSTNRKFLIFYLLLNIVIFALFSKIIELTIEDINKLLSKLGEPENIFALFTVPLSIVLEGLLSSNIKAILVFWRIKNPLPGNRAFSEIAKNDPRIDLNKLNQLFSGKLPKAPRDQNQKWYELYSRYKNENIVFDAHKVFLLTRDFTALTVTLIPICIVAHLLWGTIWQGIMYHFLVLIFFYIINSIAAQNYGKRFVANVLVKAIHE